MNVYCVQKTKLKGETNISEGYKCINSGMNSTSVRVILGEEMKEK